MKYLGKVLSLMSVLALAACSSNPFGGGSSSEKQPENNLTSNTAVAPAAQGNLNTSTDKNGNTELDLKVKHLAQPSQLSPGAKAYVVWVQPEGQNTYQNIGALTVNDNLEGTYQTKVPYKNFTLLITPESSMKAQSPSGTTVMEKNVSI